MIPACRYVFLPAFLGGLLLTFFLIFFVAPATEPPINGFLSGLAGVLLVSKVGLYSQEYGPSYLFPAFALLLPLAAVRARLLVPYVVLAISFATTLFFAFTRYPQNDLRSPSLLEDTLFTRNGQIALALLMLAVAAFSLLGLFRLPSPGTKQNLISCILNLRYRVRVLATVLLCMWWIAPEVMAAKRFILP